MERFSAKLTQEFFNYCVKNSLDQCQILNAMLKRILFLIFWYEICLNRSFRSKYNRVKHDFVS
jgi:hypothetical protein